MKRSARRNRPLSKAKLRLPLGALAHRWGARALFLSLVISLLSGGSASATQLIPYSLGALYRAADLVLLARVTPLETVYEEGRIWSRYQLQVEDQLKGQTTATTTLWSLGGSYRGIAQHVHGAPQFAPGARSLLFLRCVNDRCRAVGMLQGALRATDASDPLITPAPELAGLLTHASPAEITHREGPPVEAAPQLLLSQTLTHWPHAYPLSALRALFRGGDAPVRREQLGQVE